MRTGFGLDPDQGLSVDDELHLLRLAAELGYESAWTNSGSNAEAFERCLRWHQSSGLPVGISAVPASGQSPAFYAEHARHLWKATGGRFTLVVGSGQFARAAATMRAYLPEIRARLPKAMPLYLAALGPLMLDVAGELADGVALNWCTPDRVASSRARVAAAAAATGRRVPVVIEYIRTAVDPDGRAALRTVARAAARYLRFPAYHKHFARMGLAEELARVYETNDVPPDGAGTIGAGGKPGETRRQFERLGVGLDLAIVRVLVVRSGDLESARRVLMECRPLART